ncbi:MAG: hypothetical protein ACQEW2_04500 [Bacillota bacterium]|nr:hypothetical protein [Cytobacillus firmus]MDD9310874.1 hypothetical protein [Cytobacillus firmus]MEC1892469.1 hypothetical protein [Cytobacillus firmus]MED1908166.1 hypothetical protein [Cytobacillus firmus]MED1940623.1 hypothetical protein [Cytobacillus firmus]MED4449111.1 hypothetical protein [Cytobacillus firmus]
MEKKSRTSLLNLHGVKRRSQPRQNYEFSEELSDGGERSERFNKPRYSTK